MDSLQNDFDYHKSLNALLEELVNSKDIHSEEKLIFNKANELLMIGAYPTLVLHRLELTLRYMEILSPPALRFREHLPEICEHLFHCTITPEIFRVSPL